MTHTIHVDEAYDDAYPGDDEVQSYVRKHMAGTDDERPYLQSQLQSRAGAEWFEDDYPRNLRSAYDHMIRKDPTHLQRLRETRAASTRSADRSDMTPTRSVVHHHHETHHETHHRPESTISTAELEQALDQLAEDEQSGRVYPEHHQQVHHQRVYRFVRNQRGLCCLH